MVRASKALLLGAPAAAISKALSDFLVCPLSKQPLRQCQNTQCLISDAIGVSFPVVDDIPCLVPKDGKLLEDVDTSNADGTASPSTAND